MNRTTYLKILFVTLFGFDCLSGLSHAQEDKISVNQVKAMLVAKSSGDWSSPILRDLGVENSNDAVYPGLSGEEADLLNRGIVFVSVAKACGFDWQSEYHKTMSKLRETVKDEKTMSLVGSFHGALQQRYTDNMDVDLVCTEMTVDRLRQLII